MNRVSMQFTGAAGTQTVQVLVAGTMRERMRGLLGREALRQREGMLLKSCRLIHTYGMRYPIDVIYLSRNGKVLKVTEALAPRRMSGTWRADSVLEMAAGEACRCGIRIGLQLQVAPAGLGAGRAV